MTGILRITGTTTLSLYCIPQPEYDDQSIAHNSNGGDDSVDDENQQYHQGGGQREAGPETRDNLNYECVACSISGFMRTSITEKSVIQLECNTRMLECIFF